MLNIEQFRPTVLLGAAAYLLIAFLLCYAAQKIQDNRKEKRK